MAKSTKKKPGKRERRERRFVPRSGTNPNVVKGLYAIGAAALGAGTWGLVGKQYMTGATDAIPYSAWVAAAGFGLLGVGVWLGTTGDPAIRVGDPGIALEKGNLQRIPWWGVESISWEEGNESVVVSGKQESGAPLTFKIRRAVHADALAWLVEEARDRVDEDHIDLPEGFEDSLPKTSATTAQVIKLDPMQVVGRRCADSDEVIAYEPDARVCTRCERVYLKEHTPKKCACGAKLGDKKSKSDDADEEPRASKAEKTSKKTARAEDDGDADDKTSAASEA